MRPILKLPAQVLWLVSLYLPGLAAETAMQVPRQSIDHVGACGFLQLQKEFQRAIEHCNEALRQDPTNDQLLSNRGSALYALGRFDDALRDFNAAMLLPPQNARNFFQPSVSARRQERSRTRHRRLRSGIKLMPNLAIAYNNRGAEFEATGEREKAISDYRQALRLSPALGAIALQNLRHWVRSSRFQG